MYMGPIIPIPSPIQVQDNQYWTVTNQRFADDAPLCTDYSTKVIKDISVDIDKAIDLSIRIKKNTIQCSSFNEQTLPMLVSLAVQNLKTNSKVPVDLVCVIDKSGSMHGNKLELVKDSLYRMLSYLGKLDRVSIVTFGSTAARLNPFMKATEASKRWIRTNLKSVRAGGGTDINLGMMYAFEILKQRRYKNSVASIFLLSDGLDAGAEDKIKENLLKFKVADDVSISTFGFGKDHDPQLMSSIADLRDGNFYSIDNLETIDEAFVDCLGGVLSSVAQNVQIEIKPQQSAMFEGIKLTKAYGDASMWTYDDGKGTYITKMGTLMSGRQKDYVLEIKIPKVSEEVKDEQRKMKIASTEATIVGLDNQKIVKQADLYVILVNETEEFQYDQGDDRKVMMNFFRVKSAVLMEEARKLADELKYEDAKKILEGFKEEVENSFLKEEDFIKNMIKDIQKAIQDVNPKTYFEFGRNNMFNNQRVQMQQRSGLNMMNCFQNNLQVEMTNQLRVMKSKKPF